MAKKFGAYAVFVTTLVIASGCGSDPVRAYDECAIGSVTECESVTASFAIAVDGMTAGMCTRECGDSLDCPLDVRAFSGLCVAFPGSPFTCFESCVSSLDCAAGWACRSSAGGQSFPPICLPI